MSGKALKLMKAEHFSPDTLEFLRLLARHEVRYVIVGGEAVVYHGHARLTGDLDIFYDPETQNAQRLFDALREFWRGFVPGVHDPRSLQVPDCVFQFGRPPNRLDLLNAITGVGFQEAWDSRIREILEIGGDRFSIYYIGLEALLKNKLSVRRPRDLDDIDFLRPPGEARRDPDSDARG